MYGAKQLARDADVVLVDRHVAPAEHALALGLDRALEQRLELGAAPVVLGQEADADAVAARAAAGRESDARPRSSSSGSWSRIPAPSPVFGSAPAAPRCSRFSSATIARCDGLVRRHAVEARDEGDAAGVVLVAGVVEADGFSGTCGQSC